MAQTKKNNIRNRFIVTILLGLIGFSSILFLSVNVGRDLRLLDSASSDNVQWTLSQAEVEFLEFEMRLDMSARAPAPDLAALRREFDIFYSRIKTLREASIYAPVREVAEFSDSLSEIRTFLDVIVPVIDADDMALTQAFDDLLEATREIRGDVRTLSNSGLNFFAVESDRRRENVSQTLFQMATGVALLMLALLMFSLYLGYLNNQNIKRRRQAIQASERMNVVTSTALDAVVVSDVNGIVLDFNEAAVQIFGYEAKDAIGRDLGSLIVPDHHREAHENGMERMRNSGEKRVVGKGRIKLDAKRANGELFPVEFAIQSAQTDAGEIFISFLRDISHRVAAEENLVAARDRALAGEKAKTDFLATMSHEIRTPLNGLLGNLSLLNDTKLSAKQERYIKNMDTSGKLLMSHISDVLDITKYDAGKLQLRPVVMNVSTLLQDIVDNQSGAASAQNTTLSWGWSSASCDWIYADNERIQHILMNVIGNAVKFTRNGHISVDVKIINPDVKTPDIEITVKDTGIGMDDALKAQIFDDFMTGDASYDRDVGGTGLGLGIALRFVKAMGGTIDVQSTVGKGSVFVINFPITMANDPAVQPEQHRPAHSALPARVLLVEDNEINRVVAREMLMAHGYSVTEAHNGQIAVEFTHQQHFDIILMDISMPVMDGRAATRAIRASGGPSAKTPIIALTANAMAEEQEAFLTDGMDNILTKPLSRDALVDVISHYVEGNTMRNPIEDAVLLVDPQHIAELKEALGAPTLKTLLERFSVEVDEALVTITAGRPSGEVAQHAHRIAGSAATLGATGLRGALVSVEEAAKLDDREALTHAIDALPAVWAATQPLLKS